MGNHRIYGGPVVAGLNDRCRLVLDVLRAAYGMALKESCDALVVAGDLFDTSKPVPQLIAAVQEIIEHYPDIQTYLMLGNHDMESATAGDHALGPLRPVATLIEKPTRLIIKSRGRTTIDAVEVWAVPFQPGKAEEWLPLVLAEVQGHPSAGSSASSARVLALHLGLRDAGKTPPWLMDAHDSVSVDQVQELMKKHGIGATFAGNWHNSEQWDFAVREENCIIKRHIVQIGTLCPTGYDNAGESFGTMAVFDSKREPTCAVLRVPGPRFLNVDGLAELKAMVNEPKHDGLSIYVRVTVEPEQVPETEEFIAQVTENGFLAGGEAIADAAETQVALRQAAGVASSAETVDEAVAAYVEAMPLEDPSLRPEVMARVKEFLGGST